MRCPFCYETIDRRTLPTVAQNYLSLGAPGATHPPPSNLGGDHFEGVDDSIYGDETPPSPFSDAVRPKASPAPSANRPVSGADSFGQIGPYPILHDPQAPDSRKSSLFGPSRKFNKSDLPAKACRICEMPVPDDLTKLDVFTIGVVGNQYAGKSHYLTAMCYELLRRQRLMNLGVGTVEAVGQTGEDFHQHRYQRVYADRLAHERTTAAEGMAAAKKPLALKLHSNGGRKVVLMFHDVPGEWLISNRERARHFEFLNHLDGLIVVIDPLPIPAVRKQLANSVDPAHFYDQLPPQDLLISSLAAQVGEPRASKIPVSIVLSKADMIVQAFGEIPELQRPEASTGEQMLKDIAEINAAVEDRVLAWLDEPALAIAVEKFPTAVYHLVAPIGSLPNASTKKITGEIQSLRVVDPIFRILRGIG